jgi:hypothetical protein
MTLEQTKQALVFSQLSETTDEMGREVINALAHLVAAGEVDVFIDDSDGEIKFQAIPKGCAEDDLESIIDEITRG